MNTVDAKTVSELRQAGLTVYVTHYRVYDSHNAPKLRMETTESMWGWPEVKVRFVPPRKAEVFTRKEAEKMGLTDVSQFGGRTTVEITDGNGNTYVGIAECSRLDSYNRTIGRDIALGRALKQMKEDS